MKKLTLLIIVLLLVVGGLPARAQSDAEIRLRILNLSPEATSISVIPSAASGQLDQIDLAAPAPAVSPYYALPADVNGLGVTILRGSGMSAGGFTATFVAGHSYLLVVYQGEDGTERVLVDESAPFGGANSPALQGLAPLLLIHAVPAVGAVYRLQSAAGQVVALTLAPDPDSFSDDLPFAGVGLTASDYTLTISAADSGAPVREGLALALPENQPSVLILAGSSLDAAQLYALVGETVTPLN